MSTKEDVVGLAREILEWGVVGLNKHGNISMRDSESLYMSGSSLADLDDAKVARLGVDGSAIEGSMRKTEAEVIEMHTVVYRNRPTVGCVVHTHAPMLTTYAVASKALPCVCESMARHGFTGEVPVVGYAPRGSEAAVANIEKALKTEDACDGALILEAHGVLVYGKDGAEALKKLVALEEAASLGVAASGLGGIRGLSKDEALAAYGRS